MTCIHAQHLLNARLDGELAAGEERTLSEHLSGCAACTQMEAELERLDAMLRERADDVQDEAAIVAARVLEQLPASTIVKPNVSLWRTGIVALAAAAAGFLVAWVLLPRGLQPGPIFQEQAKTKLIDHVPKPEIQLTVSSGRVEVQEAGSWKAMPTGGFVGCGTPIRTAGKARCEFRTPDGSEVRLNHDTELKFNTTREVQVQQGQVWSTVTKGDTQFRLLAAKTIVTALGTQFDVSLNKNHTQVTVLEGKTKVESPLETVEVKAGNQYRVDSMSCQSNERQEYELLQATNWVHEILVLKGRGNPELDRRINDIFAGIGRTKMEFLLEEEIRVLGDHAVIPLTRYLQASVKENDPHKRQRAARLLGDIAQPRSIGDLITLLTDQDPQVRAYIAQGLKRLTGQEQGYSTQTWSSSSLESCQSMQNKWKAWWQANRNRCEMDP
jgi:hypothetical protein